MTTVIVLYYAFATAYLFFALIVRMRVIAIVGLFLVLVACLFVWTPYNWVFALLLIPIVFKVFYQRKDVYTAIALTIATGIITLYFVAMGLLVTRAIPEQYAYYQSPNGRYVAIEHTYEWFVFGGTNVLLCRTNGPLLIPERILYLGEHFDFGGKIEWLNKSTILIYGEKMDAFKDPAIERIFD